MRRFSIARLMFVVAALGANFAAMRFLLGPGSRRSPLRELFAGFLPLADGALLAFAVVVSRYRVAVRRRGDRRHFALDCLLLSVGSLVMGVVACCLVPDLLGEYIETVGRPVERALRLLGIDTASDTPLLSYVILPPFLGIALSGPPLLLSLALAAILSRFQLVVTPRSELPCAAPDSAS